MYGEQFMENSAKNKMLMQEIVLMEAQWDDAKYRLDPSSQIRADKSLY